MRTFGDEGLLVEPATPAPVLAKALDLENGSSQSVLIGNESELDLVSTDFTIEGWFKIEDYIQFAQVCGKKWQLRMEGAADNIANMGFYFWNGSGYVGNVSTSYLNVTAWHHIAVTFDLATTILKFWTDGALDGTHNLGDSPATTTEAFSIGNSGSQNTPWDGLLQNVRISNIKRYTSNFTPSTTLFSSDASTLGLWYLDRSLSDQSANAFNGTLQGTGSEVYVNGILYRT